MRAESETAGQVKKVSIFDIIQAQLLQKIEQALDTGERFTWIKPWTHAPYACSYHTPNRPFSAAVNYFFLEPERIFELPEHLPDAKRKAGSTYPERGAAGLRLSEYSGI